MIHHLFARIKAWLVQPAPPWAESTYKASAEEILANAKPVTVARAPTPSRSNDVHSGVSGLVPMNAARHPSR